MAPMAMGLRLASHEHDRPGQRPRELALALRHRQPVRGLVMQLSGAPGIAGRWQIDAAPAFEPGTGAYRGHAGRMRREAGAPARATATEVDSEADRMRQLLHELRTPVNAIQGFSEVIQQQLFGPAPHEYRALAASVAGDAARVLAGLEELERLARLESGRLTPEPMAASLPKSSPAVNQLRAFTEPRGSGFLASAAGDSPDVASAWPMRNAWCGGFWRRWRVHRAGRRCWSCRKRYRRAGGIRHSPAAVSGLAGRRAVLAGHRAAPKGAQRRGFQRRLQLRLARAESRPQAAKCTARMAVDG